jgi:hypothetical protein
MNCSRNLRSPLRVAKGAQPRARSIACGFALALVIASMAITSSADAAPPKITRLSLRGFQAGGTTRVNVGGTGLEGSPRLLLGVPIKEQKLVGPERSNALVFDVTLDGAAAPGVYHLRVQTTDGVSAAELVTIDPLPQMIAPTESAKPLTLPIAVHGLLAGAGVQETAFVGRKGETITIDLLARRFGSKLRPVVHLYDAQRRPLAWSLPQTALAGDVRLTATLPADGQYLVGVHDLTYAAPSNAYYRLAIGTFDFADAVYPPVVARGGSPTLELLGRFGKQSTARLDATSAAAALASSGGEWSGDLRPLPWPKGAAAIGLRPRIQLSDLPELTEEQSVAAGRKHDVLPLAICGRLQQPGEADVYEVTASGKVRVELFADRLGSPLDATLELLNDKGARAALADDVVGPDPRLDYEVPAKAGPLKIVVTDAVGRGGDAYVYRLVVTPLDAAGAPADFRLTFFDDTHHLAPNGSKVFRVAAERAGYDGPIQLKVAGLPAGIAASPVEIPAGADGAFVELRRTGAAKDAAFGQMTIRGEATDGKRKLIRVAESAVHPLGRLQPWLKGDLVAATTQGGPAFSVAWNDDSAAKSDEPRLYLGTDEKLVLKMERSPEAVGTLRLSLITTQTVPGPEGPAAQAATLIRTVAATSNFAGGKNAKPTGEIAVRIPPDLRTAAYDLAFRAELLSADEKTVLGEAFTPPRRFRAVPPLELAVDGLPNGPPPPAKSGASVAYTGTVKRLRDYTGDVTVTLGGLPANVTAPSMILKGKTEKFRLELKLPANLPPQTFDQLTAVATITPDNRRVNNAAKVEVPLPPLTVPGAEGAKPAAAKPAAKSPAPKSKQK